MIYALLQPVAKVRWTMPSRRGLAAGVGVGLALGMLNLLVGQFDPGAPPVPRAEWLAKLPGWLQVACLVALAPALEEALFRGWLPRLLARAVPGVAAVILSAIAFALLHHGVPIGVRLLMIAGALCLTMLARRFDTLVVPMIAHALINLLSIAVDGV